MSITKFVVICKLNWASNLAV